MCSCTPRPVAVVGARLVRFSAARSIREAELDTVWGVRVLAFTKRNPPPSAGAWGHSSPPHQNHPAALTNAEMSLVSAL